MRLSFRLTALATVAGAALALTFAATPAGAVATVPGTAATTGGTQLWAARFAKLEAGAPAGVAVSPQGSAVFVTGRVSVPGEAGDSMGETVAYNPATGARLWRAIYHPGTRSDVAFNNVAVSPDGSAVFVTAGIFTPYHVAGPRYLVVAYNAATGALLWVNKASSPGYISALAVSPDGSTVFVTGNGGGSSAPSTVAFNAATGAQVWGAGPGFGGASVVVSPDGSTVFVTSRAFGIDATAAYNATTGATLWTDPAPATPTQVAVSPDGSKVFVTAVGPPSPGTTYAVAYNAATGAALWTSTIARPASQMAVSPNGSTVFVTATGITVAYASATGTTRWSVRGKVTVPDLAVSPDASQVFITGGIPAPRPYALGTVAYNATTGARLWVARHTLFGAYSSGIAVSPDGSTVFVTGQNLTLAYSS